MVSADYSLYWVRRENVAWHEAAHAVVGTKLGCRVELIQLSPGLQDDGSIPEGITRFKNFRSLSRVDAIKTFLAGPLMEKRSGSSGWNKSEDDFRRIANLLCGSGGLNIKDLMAETERLLTQFSTEIKLLQVELSHKGVLVGDEILEAMRPWCSNMKTQIGGNS